MGCCAWEVCVDPRQTNVNIGDQANAFLSFLKYMVL